MANLRITLRGRNTDAGASWMSMSWQSFEAPIDPADSAAQLAEAWATNLETQLMAQVSINWRCDEWSALYWPESIPNVPPFPQLVDSLDTSLVGEANPDNLAPRVTMLLSMSAFAQTGPIRKRIYAGRYTEGGNTPNGGPNAAVVLSCQTVLNFLLLPIVIGINTWNPVVMRVNPADQHFIASNPLVTGIVRPKWAYLRSRDADDGI